MLEHVLGRTGERQGGPHRAQPWDDPRGACPRVVPVPAFLLPLTQGSGLGLDCGNNLRLFLNASTCSPEPVGIVTGPPGYSSVVEPLFPLLEKFVVTTKPKSVIS